MFEYTSFDLQPNKLEMSFQEGPHANSQLRSNIPVKSSRFSWRLALVKCHASHPNHSTISNPCLAIPRAIITSSITFTSIHVQNQIRMVKSNSKSTFEFKSNMFSPKIQGASRVSAVPSKSKSKSKFHRLVQVQIWIRLCTVRSNFTSKSSQSSRGPWRSSCPATIMPNPVSVSWL